MLVLTRRVGESIAIGDDIEVVVVALRGDQVRLGIRAPGGVAVFRAELLAQVRQENLAAARSCPEGATLPAGRAIRRGRAIKACISPNR